MPIFKVLFFSFFTFFYFVLSATAETPVPANIATCIEQSTKDLLLVTNKKEASALFYKKIERDMLGSRTYGGHAWKHFSKKAKRVALHLYFELIYSDGMEMVAGVKDISKTIIKYRMADHPDRTILGGQFHLAVTAHLDNGKTIAAAVIVTSQCKLIDIGQGAFASSVLDAIDVDMNM